MPDAPRRRLELTLTLGADTLDDLADALNQIATDLLIEGREEHNKASGRWSSGYSSILTVEPDMDGDRYRSEVSDWHRSGADSGRAIPPADDPDVVAWVESVQAAIDPDPQPTSGDDIARGSDDA